MSDAPFATEAGESRPRGAVPDPNLRFNFFALLTHGLLGQTGFRLLQAPTFLPAYLSLLAGNNSVVGIARAIQSLGMSISPYLGAWLVESRSRAKSLGILFGGAMRMQVLLLALTALLLPPRWAIIGAWLAIGLWGFASGLQAVVFNFIISKTIPAHRRGRLLGLRNASAGLTLLAVSATGGWLLERFGFPAGYGWTFLLSFALTTLGLIAFSFMREPDSESHRQRAPLLSRLFELPTLLRADRHFTNFVVARLLGTAGRGALPFYVLYIGERYGLSGTRIAVLTIVYTLADSLGALTWGLISDRTGFKRVFIAAMAAWVVGNVTIITGSTLFSAYAVFLLVGTGFSGFWMASQNLVLEFGDQRERPMRIATTNATAEMVGMVSYLGAGVLSDTLSLQWIFALSALLQVAAAVQMMRVSDPRQAAF